MSAPRGPVAAFDEAVYKVERAAVAGMLVVMGVVVFLDVVHRVSTREGGWLANPAVVGVAGTVVGGLALLTRGASGVAWKALLIGFAVAVGQAAFVQLMPNGLVWSQTLALSLTLWLGTVGASLAAHDRRHLAMDVGSKLWPAAFAPKAAALGHAITAGFCLLLLWLGGRSVAANWDLWASTDGAAGNLAGLDIPKWFPALSIPYGMAMLTFRFSLEAVRTWRGEVDLSGDDTLHQLGIQVDDGVKP